jgi:hypothetical protein
VKLIVIICIALFVTAIGMKVYTDNYNSPMERANRIEALEKTNLDLLKEFMVTKLFPTDEAEKLRRNIESATKERDKYIYCTNKYIDLNELTHDFTSDSLDAETEVMTGEKTIKHSITPIGFDGDEVGQLKIMQKRGLLALDYDTKRYVYRVEMRISHGNVDASRKKSISELFHQMDDFKKGPYTSPEFNKQIDKMKSSFYDES